MTNQTSSSIQTSNSLSVAPAILDQQSELLAQTIAQAADEKKAADLTILKTTHISYVADYLVIATGFSKTQLKAISEAIEDKVDEICHKTPLRVEGRAESSWILQDYGDVIVHLFLPEEREFYNLEAFWGHAERVEFSPIKTL